MQIFSFLVIKTLDSELDPDPQLGKCWIRIRNWIRIKLMQIHNPEKFYYEISKNLPGEQ
jgi:hypothetical protein